MSWQLAVFLKMLGGSVFAPFAFRLLGDAAPRERVERIMMQFGWAALIALLVAWLLRADVGGTRHWEIAFVGALMPLAVFFQWRAYAWSLSRGSIFMALMNIIPLLMSATLLDEWRVFMGKSMLMTGFVLAVVGIGFHLYHDIQEKRANEDAAVLPLAFYGNALAFKVILGVATFLENYWAKSAVSTSAFLVWWYSGAFCGSVVFFLMTRTLPHAPTRTMTRTKEQVLIALAATSIVLNLGLAFISFTLVEQTVAMPIFALGDIVGPMLVGFLIFGEWKGIRGWGWFYLVMSTAGVAMMALSR